MIFSPRVRTVFAGSIGNALEWYDFALFGYFAPVLGSLFFPAESKLASLLQVFGTFALGFVMRPIGGMIFGHIGDRMGRKTALQYSAILMAVPTTLIGLLPTYEQIGIWATVLLTLSRVLQGLSVGGEMIGSISFLGEEAPAGRRGFIASWSGVTGCSGSLAGSGVAALVHGLLTPEELTSWGWRIPFLFGIGVGAVGFWLRSGILESPSFQAAQAGGELVRTPLVEAFRNHFRSIVATFFLAIPFTIGFYLPFVWLSTWLTQVRQPPVAHALAANTIALATVIVLLPLSGALSDRIGRRRVYIMGTAGTVLLTYPIFVLMEHGTFTAVLCGQIAFAICLGLTGGSLPAFLVEMFPTRTRFSGIAIGYNMNVALLGGTTPLAATGIIALTHEPLSPAFYLIGWMAVATLVAWWVKEPERSIE